MKAFKIKKRSNGFKTFIVGPPITSFPKPKLPRILFSNVHCPAFYKPQINFEIVEEYQEESPIFRAANVLDLADPIVASSLHFAVGNLETGFQLLSEIAETPAEISRHPQTRRSQSPC